MTLDEAIEYAEQNVEEKSIAKYLKDYKTTLLETIESLRLRQSFLEAELDNTERSNRICQ